MKSYKQDPEQYKNRIRAVFKKYKGLVRTYNKTANFEEPVVQLMRRNGKVEFIEKVKAGEFNIKHSDGSERLIYIDPKKKHIWDYGDRQFCGYVCHEDFPYPLPDDPIITAMDTGIIVDKTLNDIKKHQAETIRSYTKMIWTIAISIGLIIAALALYTMLKPTGTEPTIIYQTAQTLPP